MLVAGIIPPLVALLSDGIATSSQAVAAECLIHMARAQKGVINAKVMIKAGIVPALEALMSDSNTHQSLQQWSENLYMLIKPYFKAVLKAARIVARENAASLFNPQGGSQERVLESCHRANVIAITNAAKRLS
eukprot:gene6691-3358_t